MAELMYRLRVNCRRNDLAVLTRPRSADLGGGENLGPIRLRIKKQEIKLIVVSRSGLLNSVIVHAHRAPAIVHEWVNVSGNGDELKFAVQAVGMEKVPGFVKRAGIEGTIDKDEDFHTTLTRITLERCSRVHYLINPLKKRTYIVSF